MWQKHSKLAMFIYRIGVSLKTKTWTSHLHHFLQFYENCNMSSLRFATICRLTYFIKKIIHIFCNVPLIWNIFCYILSRLELDKPQIYHISDNH